MRQVLNGVMYILSTGCQWRYLPKDLPPRSTVYRYFCDWSWSGALDRTKDWENLNITALAFLRLASVRLMLRKLCNPS